jgi:hypothetical protein
MKRRPLCIFCVLFLTVQAIRVLFFGAGDYTSALGQIVNRNNKGEINLILTGTADRIDEKESVTAVRVKGNAVSFYSGSLYSEKATGIVLPMISVKSCQEKYGKRKCLFILKKKMRHISKSEIN